MGTYHILSLDGGGIRGLLTAVLIERLEAGNSQSSRCAQHARSGALKMALLDWTFAPS